MKFTKQERELIQAALCSHMVKLNERAKAATARNDADTARSWYALSNQANALATRISES